MTNQSRSVNKFPRPRHRPPAASPPLHGHRHAVLCSRAPDQPPPAAPRHRHARLGASHTAQMHIVQQFPPTQPFPQHRPRSKRPQVQQRHQHRPATVRPRLQSSSSCYVSAWSTSLSARSKVGPRSRARRVGRHAALKSGQPFRFRALGMPTQLRPERRVGAILKRADPCAGPSHTTLSTLPRGLVIGTSSIRRTAHVKRYPPTRPSRT